MNYISSCQLLCHSNQIIHIGASIFSELPIKSNKVVELASLLDVS